MTICRIQIQDLEILINKHREAFRQDTKNRGEAILLATWVLYSFCLDHQTSGAGKAEDLLRANVDAFLTTPIKARMVKLS
jgi:hypothetical protein